MHQHIILLVVYTIAKILNIFLEFQFNFGRSALVNAVKLHKNKMQVDFHLTFIVDSKLKQDAKTGLMVAR